MQERFKEHVSLQSNARVEHHALDADVVVCAEHHQDAAQNLDRGWQM